MLPNVKWLVIGKHTQKKGGRSLYKNVDIYKKKIILSEFSEREEK